MHNLIPIQIRKFELNDIPIKENQIIYCVDTKEAYFDASSTKRIQIACTIQVDTERDRFEIVEPLKDKIYIVLESNSLYMYNSNAWVLITNKAEVIDLLIPASELIPTTLTQNSIHLAPKTLASQVYTNDGRQVQNVIDEMLTEDKKIVLYTKTEHVEVERDGQTVFRIPFPISNYDLDKFPVLIFLNNVLIPSKYYAISIDQLILSNTYPMLHKGDLLTFIFHYNVTITGNIVDATSVNNVRYFTGPREPYDKMATDVWFDTVNKSVKQYDGVEWQIIVKNEEFKIDIAKSTYNLNSSSTFIPIGIDRFNSATDLMFVFENSTYIEEGEDYTIDGTNIVRANQEIWYGDLEETVFNFIVFRNVKQTNMDKLRHNYSSSVELDRNTILSTLGLTEDEFAKLKNLI